MASVKIPLVEKKFVPLHITLSRYSINNGKPRYKAGIGGIRKGLEQAIINQGDKPDCVFTSEIKPYAISVLQQNHPEGISYEPLYSIIQDSLGTNITSKVNDYVAKSFGIGKVI